MWLHVVAQLKASSQDPCITLCHVKTSYPELIFLDWMQHFMYIGYAEIGIGLHHIAVSKKKSGLTQCNATNIVEPAFKCAFIPNILETAFKISSSAMTGKEKIMTAVHSVKLSGVIWNTACYDPEKWGKRGWRNNHSHREVSKWEGGGECSTYSQKGNVQYDHVLQ